MFRRLCFRSHCDRAGFRVVLCIEEYFLACLTTGLTLTIRKTIQYEYGRYPPHSNNVFCCGDC